MFQGKLNTLDEVGGFALTVFTQYLDRHDLGAWGDARLGACRALPRQDASGMGAVSVVVHGVVVLIENVIAVVRELTATVPHAIGDVDVVVVDARVDVADDDAVARVARTVVVPNRRCVDLVDMPGVGSCVGRATHLVLRNHLTHFVGDNHGNVLALSKLGKDYGTGRTAEAVERPEGFDIRYHIVGFETFKEIMHLGLRGLTKRLSIGDDEVTALFLGHQGGFLRQMAVVVTFGHHNDDMLKVVGLAKQCTEAKGQEQGEKGFLHDNGLVLCNNTFPIRHSRHRLRLQK